VRTTKNGEKAKRTWKGKKNKKKAFIREPWTAYPSKKKTNSEGVWPRVSVRLSRRRGRLISGSCHRRARGLCGGAAVDKHGRGQRRTVLTFAPSTLASGRNRENPTAAWYGDSKCRMHGPTHHDISARLKAWTVVGAESPALLTRLAATYYNKRRVSTTSGGHTQLLESADKNRGHVPNRYRGVRRTGGDRA